MYAIEFVKPDGEMMLVTLPEKRCSPHPDGLIFTRTDGTRIVFRLEDTLHLCEN